MTQDTEVPPLRLVMMGTGTFALPTFEKLIASPHEVVGLVTQPDRVHRGKVHPHPMKELAEKHNIPVLQPPKVKAAEFLEQLTALQADLTVVAAYGQILSDEVIKAPRLGTINLHGSLLPKYRGASPIQYAIWEGEQTTGVSIFQLVPELDAGPVIAEVRTPIGSQETFGELHDRLAILAVEPAIEAVEKLATGTAIPLPQNAEALSYAPKIMKHQGQIDWHAPLEKVLNHIRAMQPWPNPFTFLQGDQFKTQRLVILKAEPATDRQSPESPGQIVLAEPEGLVVATGTEPVRITQLQPAGKKPMAVDVFLNGNAVTNQMWLGPEVAED